MGLLNIEVDKYNGTFVVSAFDAVTGELLAEQEEEILARALTRIVEKALAYMEEAA
jgi:hypothetical protein